LGRDLAIKSKEGELALLREDLSLLQQFADRDMVHINGQAYPAE